MGAAFIEELKKEEASIIAFARKDNLVGDIQTYQVDLLDEVATENTLSQVDFSIYGEVVLIHAVGKFKFEKTSSQKIDLNEDGIDDDVYATNVLTLKNTLKGILNHIKQQKTLKICVFASVSDKYEIPFWASYTKAKNVLRGYLRELSSTSQVDALVVNVSSVDTGNENLLRPHADRTYWLQPKQIVLAALPKLLNLSGYQEIDVLNKKPGFNEKYYLNHEEILKKWEQEMGDY